MKIYTSYYARLKAIREQNIIPIGVSLQIPKWYDGKTYQKLAPLYSFFAVWKQNQDNEAYIKSYFEEVLDNLDPFETFAELKYLAGVNEENDRDIALLCYEKPSDFCHRHLIAEWLRKAGFNVEELEF